MAAGEITEFDLHTGSDPTNSVPEGAIQSGCNECGSADIEPEYALPLCGGCRSRLVSRPIPRWIPASALGVALLLIYSATQLPPAIAAVSAFGTGRRAERRGDFPAAEVGYRTALRWFPNSEEVVLRLAITLVRLDKPNEIQPLLIRLDGEKVVDEGLHQEFQRELDRSGIKLDEANPDDDEPQPSVSNSPGA